MCSITRLIRQYPTDDACLEGIMTLRYGGTNLDCPKCHRHGRFYRMSRERAYICQYCKFQLFSLCRHAYAPFPHILAEMVYCHIPFLYVQERCYSQRTSAAT